MKSCYLVEEYAWVIDIDSKFKMMLAKWYKTENKVGGWGELSLFGMPRSLYIAYCLH